MIRQIDMSDALLSRRQVAELLGLAEHTLACWASAGRGPAFCKFGSGRSAAVRYRRSAIEAWLADVNAGDPDERPVQAKQRRDAAAARGVNLATPARRAKGRRRARA